MVRSTFDRVLDDLGSAVVGGTIATGSRRSIDDLVEQVGASRSIVREAVRVLVGLGLLHARRRVGIVGAPPADWDVLDPRVIGWRLAGPARETVLGELRALRRAVEPAAAASAAERASDATSADGLEALLAAADRLAAATGPGDAATFLQADVDLHRLVLTLSGNAMYARLHRVVGQALVVRGGTVPDVHDVGLHLALVRAIAAGDGARAASTMLEIVDRT